MTPLKATGPQTFCGKSHILRDVGVTVNEGEIVTLLGRNGAGKTSPLRSIMGLTPARTGPSLLYCEMEPQMTMRAWRASLVRTVSRISPPTLSK